MMIVAASVSLGQTKGSKASGGNVRGEIETASKRFVEVFSKGDGAKIADMYADGARVMPPNSPMLPAGKQKIQEFWQGFINTGAKLSLSTTDVEAQGNVAIETGTYEVIMPDKTRDTGKFVVVWKREKGAWKLATDIWNSDMPMPTR